MVGDSVSVKRKFLVCGILVSVLSVLAVLLLAIAVGVVFVLAQPTVHISLTEGITVSKPMLTRALWIWATVALLVLVAAGSGIFVYLYRSVAKPMKDLETAMTHLENGDLTYEFVGTEDQEIQALCRSYEKLSHKLQTAVAKQLEQEQESRMLLANISHDIKTPVTAIRGYVEGILDGVADTEEKQRQYLTTIYAKANSIASMAENLSLYSKLEMKQMLYHFEIAELFPFLKEVLTHAELDLETNHMAYQWELPEVSCKVKLDKDAMERVVLNLIGNAIKYRKGASDMLTVSGELTEHGVLLVFADGGIGISAEKAKYVFERFYREDASRNNKIEGNGLGLSICRKIIEDHGGKIWLRSEKGEGTEVMILLPIRKGCKEV